MAQGIENQPRHRYMPVLFFVAFGRLAEFKKPFHSIT